MSAHPAPPAEPPHPIETAARRGRHAWQLLGLRLRSITPSMLAQCVLVVGALTLIGRIAWAAWDVLLPFQVGAVLAYLLLPLVDRLDRRLPRSLAIVLVFGVGLGILVLALSYLLPSVAEQMRTVLGSVPAPAQIAQLPDRIDALLETLPADAQAVVRDGSTRVVTSVRDSLFTNAQSARTVLVTSALSVINTIGFVVGFLVVPVWLFYVLKDGHHGKQAFERLLPRWMRADVLAVLHIIDHVFSSYLRGQVVLGLLVGFGVFLGLNVLSLLGIEGIHFTLLLGIFAGITDLIPTIGPIIGAVPAVIMGLFTSWETTLAIVVLYVVIQQIENAVLVPRVTGTTLNIHPAILMIVLVALSQLGIVWAILAAPLSALARDLFHYAYERFADPPRPAGELRGIVPTEEAAPARDSAVASVRPGAAR